MTTAFPWTLLPMFQYTALDAAGVPLPGAELNFYASGTATPLDTFSDANHTIPNKNPVEADQAGRFPPIYLQLAEYKVVLTDASDAEVATYDPVSPFLSSSTTVSSFYDIPVYFDVKPSVGEIYPIYNVPRALLLPSGLTGSIFTIDAAALPTATATFTLFKNNITIGTIAFSAGGSVTVSFLSSVTFSAGDQFKMVAPNPADATANFIAFTFVFTVL